MRCDIEGMKLQRYTMKWLVRLESDLTPLVALSEQ
jgi:hypothetical protein